MGIGNLPGPARPRRGEVRVARVRQEEPAELEAGQESQWGGRHGLKPRSAPSTGSGLGREGRGTPLTVHPRANEARSLPQRLHSHLGRPGRLPPGCTPTPFPSDTSPGALRPAQLRRETPFGSQLPDLPTPRGRHTPPSRPCRRPSGAPRSCRAGPHPQVPLGPLLVLPAHGRGGGRALSLRSRG